MAKTDEQPDGAHVVLQRHCYPFMEIKGQKFGVRFVPRGGDGSEDQHICIQLRSEDDGNWFNVGGSFSSFWLDDLRQQLKVASKLLKKTTPDPEGFGYTFDG